MMLELNDIRFHIGDTPILDGIDLSASAGQVTAIVGPNGSGKTTLLKAITGEIAASGQVRINGLDIRTASLAQLATLRGVLPQASVMAFPFTVIEVVRLGHQAGAYADQAEIPMQALAKVGLADFAGRTYQDLSGGEQQRVQLARVLAQVWLPMRGPDPSWLFLDEPVSSLDIGHQLDIADLVRAYAEGGGGVLAVMHDLNLTAMMADQIAVMRSGQILARGSRDDVITNDILSLAYDCQLQVSTPPTQQDVPYLLPQAALRKARQR